LKLPYVGLTTSQIQIYYVDIKEYELYCHDTVLLEQIFNNVTLSIGLKYDGAVY